MTRFNRYYLLLAILCVIYGLLIFLIPPDGSVLTRYSISATQARWLSLSLAVPLAVIWTAAFYGFIYLKKYANHVQPTRDGVYIARIAHGLMYLAIAMPVNSISSSLSNYVASSRPHLKPLAVIANNYLSLILVLIGFYLISRGAQGLVSTLKKHKQYSDREQLAIGAFVIVSAIYCYVTLTNPARQFETANVSRAAYYLADFPLVVTIIIPYLFVWFFGIRAAYNIYLYSRRVKGVVYREALGGLAAGLAIVIVSSMLVRYLVSLTTLFQSLSLKILLLVLYTLVFIIFAGYLLIARGTRKLQRIEEV